MFGYISVLVRCCAEYPATGVTNIDSLALSLLTGILESPVVSDADLTISHRYIALANNKDGTGPLASYFKGEVLHGHDTDIFTSNMCTYSTRLLCSFSNIGTQTLQKMYVYPLPDDTIC